MLPKINEPLLWDVPEPHPKSKYLNISIESNNLLSMVGELNNIAVDMYIGDHYQHALRLYNDATKALQPCSENMERNFSFDNILDNLLYQITQGKEQLKQLSFSQEQLHYEGINSYQWSDSDFGNNVKYLSKAFKISSCGDSLNENSLYDALSILQYNMGLAYMKTEKKKI